MPKRESLRRVETILTLGPSGRHIPVVPNGHDAGQAVGEAASFRVSNAIELLATGAFEIGAATPVVAPLSVALLHAKGVIDGVGRNKDDLEELCAWCDLITVQVIDKEGQVLARLDHRCHSPDQVHREAQRSGRALPFSTDVRQTVEVAQRWRRHPEASRAYPGRRSNHGTRRCRRPFGENASDPLTFDRR